MAGADLLAGEHCRQPGGGGGASGGDDRPLRLVGTALYLDRYWRDERAVAADLRARSQQAPLPVDALRLGASLSRLFPEPGASAQRRAAANAVRRGFSVIAGGPGTGKTTTVARLLALVHEQALSSGAPPPVVALAAPTGKAAARMAEAVHDEAANWMSSRRCASACLVEASTVHRLLGRHPASSNRFRHHGGNQLPHDLVVVDEASMMSLPLMARLLEAVRADARLLLVGDHEQLASVEAGAVFGDIVGPAAIAPASGPPRARRAGHRDGLVRHCLAGQLPFCRPAGRAGRWHSGRRRGRRHGPALPVGGRPGGYGRRPVAAGRPGHGHRVQPTRVQPTLVRPTWARGTWAGPTRAPWAPCGPP